LPTLRFSKIYLYALQNTEIMELFLELLKYTLPAVAVLIVVYMMLSSFFKEEENRRMFQIRKETTKVALPLRLQAYERYTLLLERITPINLVMRLTPGKQNVKTYQSTLIAAIRQEYEHNVAQQIYISPEAFSLIKTAKDTTISIINQSVGKMEEGATAEDLAKRLLSLSIEKDLMPTQRAIDFLKEEVKKLF
jgi:hypothetical protein